MHDDDSLAEDFLAGPRGNGASDAGHDRAHGGHDPAAGSTNVREFDHGGHHVRIETTYRISIDGEPLHGHIEALPSGRVHYHGFPQYAPQSAVDVVKTVIDTIWDKPEVPDELAGTDAGHEHGHAQEHGHGGEATS